MAWPQTSTESELRKAEVVTNIFADTRKNGTISSPLARSVLIMNDLSLLLNYVWPFRAFDAVFSVA